MSDAPDRTAAAHDEISLIGWIRQQEPASEFVPIGIGDDCAGLRLPPKSIALVTTDMLISGVHFNPARTSPRQIGHKAIARAVSDIAAMAGDALAVVVALAAPPRTREADLRELYHGMRDAASAMGVRIIGGDVSSGGLPLTLTVTVIGAAREGCAVLRSGARAGDRVLVTGDLGGSLEGRHLTFLPRLREAQWLREIVALHAMIDISDGLSVDAAHLAEESGVAIELHEDAIPVSEAARVRAAKMGIPPLEHALHDGEDYELLFTVAASDADTFLRRADCPVKVTCIGEVKSGSGVHIGPRGGAMRPLERRGWVHNF